MSDISDAFQPFVQLIAYAMKGIEFYLCNLRIGVDKFSRNNIRVQIRAKNDSHNA